MRSPWTRRLSMPESRLQEEEIRRLRYHGLPPHRPTILRLLQCESRLCSWLEAAAARALVSRFASKTGNRVHVLPPRFFLRAYTSKQEESLRLPQDHRSYNGQLRYSHWLGTSCASLLYSNLTDMRTEPLPRAERCSTPMAQLDAAEV